MKGQFNKAETSLANAEKGYDCARSMHGTLGRRYSKRRSNRLRRRLDEVIVRLERSKQHVNT